MKTPAEYDVVRLISIADDARAFTGTPGVARAPRIGDVGTVVHVYAPDRFAVECTEARGMTLWLADFHLGELEVVESRDASQRPEIDIEMWFLPVEQGGREHLPELSMGRYRPHLRIPSSRELLGVQFLTLPYGKICHNAAISATVRPLDGPEVTYELLQPGVAIEIVEGARVVAHGCIIRLR